MDWNIGQWVSAYLLAGGTAATAVLLYTHLRDRKAGKSEFVKSIMASIRPEPSWSQVLIDISVRVLGFSLLTLVWPGIPFMYLWAARKDGPLRVGREDPEDRFTIKSEHLLRTVNAESIEAQSVVLDPLGRAPQLPFGHLNGAWKALLAQIKDGGQLWYAEVPDRWTPSQKNGLMHQYRLSNVEMRGYAIVRSRKVVADFIYESS